MNKSFDRNVLLSHNVCDDFSYRLANPDTSAPRGIDTFLTAAQKLNIRHEGTDVIVESENINEDAVIAALMFGGEKQ